MFSVLIWQTYNTMVKAYGINNWSVISQWLVSAPAPRLLMSSMAQAGFSPSAWRAERCHVPVCPPGVSVALCCFSLTGLPLILNRPRPSSVCQDLLYFSLLTVCAFYLFFSSPQTLLTFSTSFWYLYFCSSSLPSDSFFSISIFHALIPPSFCHLYLSDSILVYSTPLPPRPLLCCGGPQKRSGQMVSDDFRALLISTGNSLVLLLAWCSFRVSAGLWIS